MEKRGYYVYYSTTSSFSPEEKRHLHELFGPDFFHKDVDKDLSDEQVQRILSRIKPAMKRWLNTQELLPFLKRHHVLTDSELQLLNSSTLSHSEQAIRLVEFLVNKGSYGIAAFYLSLITSSEKLYGLPAHYQLAGELKETVHAESGIVSEDPGDDTVSTTSNNDASLKQPLRHCLVKLRGIRLGKTTAEALISNLGLNTSKLSTVPSSLEQICSMWLLQESNPFLDDLIQALVLTKGTGKYASAICSVDDQLESPAVRNFFLSLGDKWQSVAEYLGYSTNELEEIVKKFPDSIKNQVSEFLDIWQLPYYAELSLPLLHRLKSLCGITSDHHQSRKLVDRTDVPSYVYMNKRLKTDAEGIPHRSLDSFEHSTRRTQSLKAPYSSFTSFESTSPLASSPPKPPRSHSSSVNQPRDGPISGSHQQRKETDSYRNQSLSNSNLASGSPNYNKPTSSLPIGTTFTARVNISTTQEPRRAPPPPPPPKPSPGLHDDMKSSTDMHGPQTGTRVFVMFFTGGNDIGVSSNDTLNHVRRTDHTRPNEEDPVIEELPDDYDVGPTGDSRSADGSLPPLSDGRASPMLDEKDLNELDDMSHFDRHVDQDKESSGSEANQLNDLGVVTPPVSPTVISSTVPITSNDESQSQHSMATDSLPVPAFSGESSGGPDKGIDSSIHDRDTPIEFGKNIMDSPVDDQCVDTVEKTSSHDHSNLMDSTHVASTDVRSSTYPPSTYTGDRDAAATSEVSTSLPGQTVGDKTSRQLASPIIGTRQDVDISNIKEGPIEPPKLDVPTSTEHATLINDVYVNGPDVIPEIVRPDIQAPDRRHHSRARLDSLEERNNLDTDSELESFSESEKESDTEEVFRVRPRPQQRTRSVPRERSLSLSSSEDEEFTPGARNDLSIVSRPPHELPAGSDGHFGVSLSTHKQSDDSKESTMLKNMGVDMYGRDHPSMPKSRSASGFDVDRDDTEFGPVTEHLAERPVQSESSFDIGDEYSSQQRINVVSKGGPSIGEHRYIPVRHSKESSKTQPTVQVTRTSAHIESGSSSSDHLQLPVRRSFSSLPVDHNSPSCDEQESLKAPHLEMPSSAPTTGIQMMLDQPPPPFTHYAAPPPIFTAHVMEQSSDYGYSTTTFEFHDEVSQTGSGPGTVVGREELSYYSDTRLGMEDHPVAMASHSLFPDNPTTEASSLQSTELDHVAKQKAQVPSEFLSQDIVQALEDPDGLEVLSALLESGANINLPTKDGEYAVHIALRVEKGLDKLKLLLKSKADRNVARSSDLMTPLHLACLRQELEIVQLLLDDADIHPCPLDSRGLTPLHFKKTLEKVEITRSLINKGAAVDLPTNKDKLTPLVVCCAAGTTTFDAACLLVQSGADVNGHAQSPAKPLIIASQSGFEALVQLLLERDADVNVIDQDQSTSLLKVCQNKPNNLISVARRLCQQSFVDINLPNKDGVTPLMAAVRNNARDLVMLLVQNGANHEVSQTVEITLPGCHTKSFEITPMADAAIRGLLEIIQILVDYGANINALNMHALPPITGAVLAGHAHIVEYFTKQNDLDCSLEGLMQPFIMAVQCRNQLCAELLIERYPGGIDVMLRSASDQGLEELVQCIESFQQESLECSSGQPQVVLSADQLPWDARPHSPDVDYEDLALLISDKLDDFTQQQLNISGMTEDNGACLSQQEYGHDSQPITGHTPNPQDLDQSSVHSASLAAHSHAEGAASSSVLQTLPPTKELQTKRAAATVQEMTASHSDGESLNRFDDDTDSGDESGGVARVLHVDDPRLAFGQSVYVSQRDRDESTQAVSVLTAPTLDQPFSVASPGMLPASSEPSYIAHPGSTSQEHLESRYGCSSATLASLATAASFAPSTMGTTSQSMTGDTPTLALPTESHSLAHYQPQIQSQERLLNNFETQSLPPGSVHGAAKSDPVTSSLGFPMSGPPLRARAPEDDDIASGPMNDDQRLFAPRPKSPPPQDTSTPPVHNESINLKTPTSMGANVVEILHEFAQLAILAAAGRKGQEHLVDRAMGSGFEHIAMFFFNYFNNPTDFGGSNLVSEFIGGSPSPLNFLLHNVLVTKVEFERVLSDMGKKDEFPGQLMIALHQFPGSDNLPWTGEGMLSALFNRTFSIGSLHPSMRPTPSLMGGAANQVSVNDQASPPVDHTDPERPDTPPPPKPISGPIQQKEHTFPETGGHRLGHGSADLAKANNPRNIVTPTVSQSHKATPSSWSTASLSVPRKLSSGSIASTTSSLSAKPCRSENESGVDPKKKRFDVASLSSSLAASHESLNSATSSGQQMQSSTVSSKLGGNEVDKSSANAKKRQQTLHALSSENQRDSSEVESGEQSIDQGKDSYKLPSRSSSPTTASVETRDVRQSGRNSPQSIQLQNIGHVTSGELNDIDADSPPLGSTQLPLSLMGMDITSSSTDAQTVLSSRGCDTTYQDKRNSKEEIDEDQPSNSSDWGACLSDASHADQKGQLMPQSDYDDEINDLDSDGEAVPRGPAFDVIDNVSMSMSAARMKEGQPAVLGPFAVSQGEHQLPLAGASVTSSSVQTVQLLPTDSTHSKYQSGPLKSTYGVGGGDLQDDDALASSTAVCNFDPMKSDVVQPLVSASDESQNAGHTKKTSTESIVLDELNSSEFHHLDSLLPASNTTSSVSPNKLSGKQELDEDKTTSTQYDTTTEASKIVSVGGVPLTSKNDSIANVIMGTGDKTDSKSYVDIGSKSHRLLVNEHDAPPGHVGAMQMEDSSLDTERVLLTSSPNVSEVKLSKPKAFLTEQTSEGQASPAHRISTTNQSDSPQPTPSALNIGDKGGLLSLNRSLLPSSTASVRLDETRPIPSVPLKLPSTLVQSDSTDTETDEESRTSLTSTWRLDSRVRSYDLSSSTGEAGELEVTFSTSGAWKRKQIEKAGTGKSSESKIPSSLGDVSQSSETPSIQKHAVTQCVKTKEHSGTLDSSVNVHSDISAKGRTALSQHKLTGTPPIPTYESRLKLKVNKQASVNRRHVDIRKGSGRPTTKSPAVPKKQADATKRVSPNSFQKLERKRAVLSSKVSVSSQSRDLSLRSRPSKSTSSPHQTSGKPEELHKSRSVVSPSLSRLRKPNLKLVTPTRHSGQTVEKRKHHPALIDEEVVKRKPLQDLTVSAVHHAGSDHSTIGSSSSQSLIVSEHHMRILSEDLAKHSELIFGISIPDVMISSDHETEMFETIATHISKWKMLGRYLGLEDEVLDEIEDHNHFTGEKCLKMLMRFKSDVGSQATYVRLATALKDTMNDRLISDISKYFPLRLQSLSSIHTYSIQLTSDISTDRMINQLSDTREDFTLQRNDGKRKARVQVSYPPECVDSRANDPLCFELNLLDSGGIRVIEDVCIAAAYRKVKKLHLNITYL